MKTLYLISLFILLPLGEVTRYQFGNGTALSLFDIAAVGNLIFVIFTLLRKNHLFSLHLVKPLLIFSFCCLLSLVANIFVLPGFYAMISGLYILRFLGYASFYVTVILLGEKTKHTLPLYFTISGIFIALFGITQFFLYPTLQNLSYLGWDIHWYRLFATFFDPNFAGIVLLIPFFYSLFISYKSIVARKKLLSFMYSFFTFFLLITVYLTFSRTALIALVGGLILFFLYSKVAKWIVASIFGILIFGIIIISINYKATEGTKLYRIASSKARLDSASIALSIFEKNPIFGVGFNAYRYAQLRYGYASGTNWETSHSGAGTDNSLLFILATTGIVGSSSFIFLLYSIIVSFKHNASEIVPTITAITTSILIGSLFINAIFYPAIMFLFWSSLGLIEKKK